MPMTEFFNLRAPSGEGIRLRVSNLGASLISVYCPDRDGQFEDVIVGPETTEQLEDDTAFMGATVGRFANRIAQGKFSHAGSEVQLTLNDGVNHLHGGTTGVHKQHWKVLESSASEVLFGLESPDGTDGYPGCLQMTARYRILDAVTFEIKFEAQSDQCTPVSLANHAYWNLSGDPVQSVGAHEIQSHDVTQVLEAGEGMIPSGQILPVAGGVFDFSTPRPLTAAWDSENAQIQAAGGYDHCLVFADGLLESAGNTVNAYDPSSGRTLSIATNMPGVQLYTGNFLDASQYGKGGLIGHRTGFCIETQHFPNAMNEAHFPSPMLEVGELYQHRMLFQLGVRP